MQYLLKITLKDTPLWRLIAVDGDTDLSHVANLMSQSFDYESAPCAFIVNGKKYSAGEAGDVKSLSELKTFDSFNLQNEDEFTFIHDENSSLEHHVLVMKAVDHLFCLMPSCLVGQGLVPKDRPLTYDAVREYLDCDDTPSLDLREVTKRLRALGAKRKDQDKPLQTLSAKPLDFKIK